MSEVPELCKLPKDPKDTISIPPVKVVWKQPGEEELKFVQRFLGLGVNHVLQLLRYCVPEDLRSEKEGEPVVAFKRQRSSVLGQLSGVSEDVEKVWNAPLPRELLIQSQTKLLCRALSVGRKIVKAITVTENHCKLKSVQS